MILSAHQGGYLPWEPLLDRIAQSDIFILLDGCQFEKGSFTNRQRLGNTWLTIPVNAHGKPRIRDTIITSQQWRRKHYQFLYHRYGAMERYDEVVGNLEWMYGEWETKFLGSYLARHLVFWCQEYDITTPIQRMPQDLIWQGGTDLIVRLCEHYGADTYLSGPLGSNYLDEEKCHEKNIRLEYYRGSPGMTESIMERWMRSPDNPFLSSRRTRTMKLSDAQEPSPATSQEAIMSTS